NNLAQVEIAGQAISIFNKLVKSGVTDENLFFLLTDFLSIIDSGLVDEKNLEFFKQVFVFKLLSLLGHGAELGECVFCKTKLKEEKNIFDFHRGGMLCCHHESSGKHLTISPDCVKLLRLMQEKDFIFLAKIKANNSLFKEAGTSIRLFYNYINE
ncbi:MAG: DNA repair protein RecO, partial [Bacteriovorax sp.]|nr:DNA repair protein RecO [Bacteriovorax sp.]